MADRIFGTLAGLLLAAVLLIYGCTIYSNACDNHPVEVETYVFKKIKRNNEHQTVEFSYNNETGTMPLKCTGKQWLRIYHILNQDWENRYKHKYTVTYRNGTLLSFYRINP